MSHEEGTERFGIQLSGLPGPIGLKIARRLSAARGTRFVASPFVDKARDRPKPAAAPPSTILDRPSDRLKILRRVRTRRRSAGPSRAVSPELIRETPIVTRPLPPDINIPRPGAPKVSIHRELGNILRDRVLSAARGRVGGPSGGARQASMIALPAPVIAAGGRIAAGGVRRVARAVGLFAAGAQVGSFFARNDDGSCPVGTHPIKQDGVNGPAGSYCVRNRRMNVGNARAARRSVRRLTGARKLLRDIEKMMPTKTTRRRAPAGHAAHLHHTGGS